MSNRSGYAHNEHHLWIERNTKQTCSPLGREVANVLGYVGGGIYNAPIKPHKIDWTQTGYIEVAWRGELANWDHFGLTALWVEAARRCLRVSIRGCGPNYLKILFHQRTMRDGGVMEALPDAESMIRRVDEHWGREPTTEQPKT